MLDLHGLSDGDEAAVVQACIEAMQRGQAEVNLIINGAEHAKRAKAKADAAEAAKPVIRYPKPAPPPQYGPATGIHEAKPKQQSVAARQFVAPAADDDEYDEGYVVPDNLDDAGWLDHCRRKYMGLFNYEAMVELQKDRDAWAMMDDSERKKAVTTLGAKLEHDEHYGTF